MEGVWTVNLQTRSTTTLLFMDGTTEKRNVSFWLLQPNNTWQTRAIHSVCSQTISKINTEKKQVFIANNGLKHHEIHTDAALSPGRATCYKQSLCESSGKDWWDFLCISVWSHVCYQGNYTTLLFFSELQQIWHSEAGKDRWEWVAWAHKKKRGRHARKSWIWRLFSVVCTFLKISPFTVSVSAS